MMMLLRCCWCWIGDGRGAEHGGQHEQRDRLQHHHHRVDLRSFAVVLQLSTRQVARSIVAAEGRKRTIGFGSEARTTLISSSDLT